ncbi:MAG: hypothetical protein QOH48_932 [Actinomycetota bacterium]|jgi:uncharacterized protein (DUF2236 family)|nr:hypothetical protein [Actinomycetota bacterium]
MTQPLDDGFFGPDSVTWRIHAHRCMLVGGIRALLLQALNSRAMAAVADFSTYKSAPWQRLTSTSIYLIDTVFGDTETAEAAAQRVRRIHRSIKGVDSFTGEPYSAEDPELLLWIHAAEVDSFLEGYRHFGPPISDDDANRYVAEMVSAAELIGLDAAGVPSSVGELHDYMDGQELVASPAAREALWFILKPPVPWPGGKWPAIPGGRLVAEVPARIGWAVPSGAAAAILPPRALRAYNLPNVQPSEPFFRLALPAFFIAMRAAAGPPPGIETLRARGFAA